MFYNKTYIQWLNIANSLAYYLIDGLSLALAKTAPYVTNRNSCTCHPQRLYEYNAIDGTKQ